MKIGLLTVKSEVDQSHLPLSNQQKVGHPSLINLDECHSQAVKISDQIKMPFE